MKECCVEGEKDAGCLVKSDLNIGEESLIMECLFEDHRMHMCFAKSVFEDAFVEKTMVDPLWDSCSDFVDENEVNAISTITKDNLIGEAAFDFLKIMEHEKYLEEEMFGAFGIEYCFIKNKDCFVEEIINDEDCFVETMCGACWYVFLFSQKHA